MGLDKRNRLWRMNMAASRRAVTLVEVLVSATILVVLVVTFGYAFTTMFMANQISGDRSRAVSLLQKSQEEILRAAQILFDSLNLCRFPGDPQFGMDCGFDDILDSARFPEYEGFQRTLEITQEAGTTELRRARVVVSWTDFRGASHELDSVFLIARPPDSLPGNIIGLVSADTPPGPLAGVTVSVQQQQSPGKVGQSQSLSEVDDRGVNYSISGGSPFALPVGTYQLTATAAGYKDYTHSSVIIVDSGKESQADIVMEALPEPAVIRVNFTDLETGSPVFLADPQVEIGLYSDGVLIQRLDGCSGSCEFTVEFLEIEEKRFTVSTRNTIRAGWVGDFNCFSPRTHQPDGWSSAQKRDEIGTLNCLYPYNGNQDADRIVVQSGQTVDVMAGLVLVPAATVTGRVDDQQGNPLPGARLSFSIPERVPGHGSGYSWPGKNTQSYLTNNAGFYTLTVPAQEALYGNNPGQYVRIRAQASVMQNWCCEEINQVDRFSADQSIGPLWQATSLTAAPLVVDTESPADQSCGNLNGTIRDAKQGGGLATATVKVQSLNRNSNGAGNYIFQCDQPDQGFRLLTGDSHVNVNKNGYYYFSTQGNFHYALQTRVFIQANQMTEFNARLWPVGRGNVRVMVIDQDSGLPVSGARVELRRYAVDDVNKQILESGVAGVVTFNNFWETWPPVTLPSSDQYFNQTPQRHGVIVTHPFYQDGSAVITQLNAGQTLTLTVNLKKKFGSDFGPGL